MPDEGRQQAELERRQRDLGAVDGHASLREVHGQKRVRVGLASLGPASGPAEHGLDPGEQLLPAERLGDVVVGARLEAAHLLQLGRPGGQHRHRHVGKVADALERLPTIQLGHRDVQEDGVRRRRVERPQRILAVGGLGHLVALTLQELANEAADVRVVVDNEHVRTCHAGSIPDNEDDPFRGRIRAQAMT